MIRDTILAPDGYVRVQPDRKATQCWPMPVGLRTQIVFSRRSILDLEVGIHIKGECWCAFHLPQNYSFCNSGAIRTVKTQMIGPCHAVGNLLLLWGRGEKHQKPSPGDKKRRGETPDHTERGNSNVLAHDPIIRALEVSSICFFIHGEPRPATTTTREPNEHLKYLFFSIAARGLLLFLL